MGVAHLVGHPRERRRVVRRDVGHDRPAREDVDDENRCALLVDAEHVSLAQAVGEHPVAEPHADRPTAVALLPVQLPEGLVPVEVDGVDLVAGKPRGDLLV